MEFMVLDGSEGKVVGPLCQSFGWLVGSQVLLLDLILFLLDHVERADVEPDAADEAILSEQHERDLLASFLALLGGTYGLLVGQVRANDQVILGRPD